MQDKTVNITNFIGVYDGYISKEECNNAIKLYEEQNKFNNTLNRIDFEQASILGKQDQQFFAPNLAILSASLSPSTLSSSQLDCNTDK